MSRAGDQPISRTRLENGLEVRLKEMRTAPLISSWLWYRVGSRNERPGTTGISHWVEHMQFKGTPTFPAGVLDRAISRDGGTWNAGTWLDWTVYYETMPAGRIDLALDLEADRMVNSLFEPAEVESERTVIISEREGHENEPGFRLDEEMQAAAFRVHSYHHEVIGDMADLHAITRDDLYAHYRNYYRPANAVLALAGDFETEDMLERVRQRFGSLDGGTAPAFESRPEPPQRGERQVVVEGPEETPILEVAYRAPEPTDSAFYALAVLDSVLTGASSFSPYGSGLSNKTSRLYRALVEGGVAAAVSGGLAATIDPYLYSLRATIRPGQPPEVGLQVIDDELARLQDAPISQDEVDKAIKQAKAIFAYDSESISNQAFWLGYSEMFADYGWFESYLDEIDKVTPEDLLRAAHQVLVPAQRVVGMFRPTLEAVNGR
ncbi:MAG TPA: pitrilysin family protein [Anaerolineales bacterium]